MVDDARADRDALDYLRAGHVAAALALLGAAWTTPAFTAADPPPLAFLRQYLRASDSELRRLERGEPITRTLQSTDSREITTLGAIRVTCTADTFISRVRDVERFKASEYLLQVGRFSEAPSIDDVATLELDAEDRRDLRDCRPGKCGLRLPAADITGLRRRDPDAAAAWRQTTRRLFLEAFSDGYVAVDMERLPDRGAYLLVRPERTR